MTILINNQTLATSENDRSVRAVASTNSSEWTFERSWPVAGPVVLLVFLSLLIRWTDFDLLFASLFYDRENKCWPYEVAEPWMSIYRHGTIPSIILGIVGVVVALFGKTVLPWFGLVDSVSVRRAGFFLFVMLLLGPGLIINLGFKELWGRPRPLQCTAFGGERPFVPVGTWGHMRTSNSSFPSGHAAVAFYLMAPGFIARAGQRRIQRASFGIGILYGLGMGLTRAVQGGHFVSDVIWAGAMVYLTGVVLAWWLLRNENPS